MTIRRSTNLYPVCYIYIGYILNYVFMISFAMEAPEFKWEIGWLYGCMFILAIQIGLIIWKTVMSYTYNQISILTPVIWTPILIFHIINSYITFYIYIPLCIITWFLINKDFKNQLPFVPHCNLTVIVFLNIMLHFVQTTSYSSIYCMINVIYVIIGGITMTLSHYNCNYEYNKRPNHKFKYLFQLCITLEILLVIFMIDIAFFVFEFNWILFIVFLIISCQAFTTIMITNRYLTKIFMKLGYKLFIDQSDGTFNDIYDRIYCFYHHCLHHKPLSDLNSFKGFGYQEFMNDNLQTNDYDEDELTVLINTDSKLKLNEHPKFSSRCITLFIDFRAMQIERKKELIGEMMKLEQFEYLHLEYKNQLFTTVLFMIGLSLMLSPYLFINGIIGHIQNMMIAIRIFTVILIIAYSVILILLIFHLWKLKLLSWKRLRIVKWSKVYNMDKMFVSSAMDIYNKVERIDTELQIVSKYLEVDVALLVLSYLYGQGEDY